MVATTTVLQRAQVGSRSFPLHLPGMAVADDPPPTTDADDLEQDHKERTALVVSASPPLVDHRKPSRGRALISGPTRRLVALVSAPKRRTKKGGPELDLSGMTREQLKAEEEKILAELEELSAASRRRKEAGPEPKHADLSGMTREQLKAEEENILAELDELEWRARQKQLIEELSTRALDGPRLSMAENPVIFPSMDVDK